MSPKSRPPAERAGLRRRDVFKLGAAAAAGAGVITLERAALPRRAQAQLPGEFLLAEFGFIVDVPGLPALSAAVQRVSVDPLRIKAGRRRPRKPLPTEARFVVRADPAARAELFSWVESPAFGTCARKNISIQLLDATGSPARSFTLVDCLPLSWSFHNYDVLHGNLTYSFTVLPNRVELQPRGGVE